MNTVHVCLIPSGVHRGEVLVWDGNLFNHPVRAFQPWSIVNPYWPALNPNPWPGQAAVQHRFHNATLAMPLVGGVPEGELFCAGQCWMADGRLLVCGGTQRYPFQTGGWFEGTKFVYQWDPTPQTGDPFGRWSRMADLEAARWYPTVTYDGTTAHRGIVIGGTNWTQAYGTLDVNSYEVVRIAAFNAPLPPALLTPPNDFDRKPLPGTTPVGWPIGPALPLPAQSRRQYWGPHVPAPISQQAFGDYPRIHALGILDPIPGGGTAPRLFVSGFPAWGVHWAHDASSDPVFGTALTGPAGQGYEIGQFPINNATRVLYPTSLLLPAAIGGISTLVARIGGGRLPAVVASELVETVKVDSMPSSWVQIPSMIKRRFQGNVVMLPTGELFAIGGSDGTAFNLTPELFVGGTTWVPMAAHPTQACPRDYHSAAILLPDARVFVCGGENRKIGFPGTDYAIWEPPYFHDSYGALPPTGITVVNAATSLVVPQDQIVPGMDYGQAYTATWTNTLEPGISVESVVLMRPAALTHHDDGGQRMVRLVAWDDGGIDSISFMSPASVRHAPPGWWMLFLVTNSGRPSQAYWVHLL